MRNRVARRRRRSGYNLLTTAAASLSTGALLMYLFDPERGARRRSMARDQVEGSVNDVSETLGKTWRYTSNKVAGVISSAKSRLSPDNPSDSQLEGRVRSTLGRAVTHPRAIETEVAQGKVTLRGPVPEGEVKSLLSAVKGVRGVREVVSELKAYGETSKHPSLQGAGKPGRVRRVFLQENWSPSARMLAGLSGGALSALGLVRRDWLGALLGGAGAAVLLRSTINKPFKRIFGVGPHRRAVDVEKTIIVEAPLEKVFNFFADYGNFPLFMRNVREVSFREPDITHWVVRGPAGTDVSWDAEISKFMPNKYIAWKSIPGSTVANAGFLHFEGNNERTRVHVRMSYNPPAGVIGHAGAVLFGVDPRKEMDEDLLRVKTSIETGTQPRDAAANQ